MSDATIRPVTVGTGDWDVSTVANINEVITQPSTSGDGTYCRHNGSSTKIQEWILETPSDDGTITGVTVWMRVSAEEFGDNEMSVRLKVNGTWHTLSCTSDPVLSDIPEWKSYIGTFSGGDMIGSSPVLEVTGSGESSSSRGYLHVAYAELSYTPPSGIVATELGNLQVDAFANRRPFSVCEVTLGPITCDATANIHGPISGSLTAVLGMVSLQSVGRQEVNANASIQLDSFVTSNTAVAEIALDGLQFSIVALDEIIGAADLTLGSLQVNVPAATVTVAIFLFNLEFISNGEHLGSRTGTTNGVYGDYGMLMDGFYLAAFGGLTPIGSAFELSLDAIEVAAVSEVTQVETSDRIGYLS